VPATVNTPAACWVSRKKLPSGARRRSSSITVTVTASATTSRMIASVELTPRGTISACVTVPTDG
jgi:hypothetical protein